MNLYEIQKKKKKSYFQKEFVFLSHHNKKRELLKAINKFDFNNILELCTKVMVGHHPTIKDLRQARHRPLAKKKKTMYMF